MQHIKEILEEMGYIKSEEPELVSKIIDKETRDERRV